MSTTPLPALSGGVAGPQSSRIHIPVLDGIRGLAVLLVMFAHLTVTESAAWPDRAINHVAKYGWSGVDLFFVLSGFLITGILYDAKDSDRYFGNFYLRRVLRIFPLYYAVIFFAAVVLPRFTSNPDFHLDHHGLWYWTYLQNIGRAWFGAKSNFVVDVTWSLAIEEQYYVLWPLVVFYLSRRALLRVSLMLALFSVASRLVLIWAGTHFDAVYVSTFSHLDGISLGSWLALVARGPRGLGWLKPVAWISATTAVAVIAGISSVQWDLPEAQFFSTPLMQAAGYTALSVFYAAVLLLAVTLPAQHIIPRLLGGAWLRWFGRYSYALYLLHFPISVLVRVKFGPERIPVIAGSHMLSQLAIYVIAGGTSMLLALLSWHLLEKHCLRLKDRFTEPAFRARHHPTDADGRPEPAPTPVA